MFVCDLKLYVNKYLKTVSNLRHLESARQSIDWSQVLVLPHLMDMIQRDTEQTVRLQLERTTFNNKALQTVHR